MKTIKLFLILMAVLALASCGRGEKDSAAEKAGEYGGLMTGALRKAQGMGDVLNIKHEINLFYSEDGRYPASLKELVEKNYLEEIPEAPSGMVFHYDSSTGVLELKETSSGEKR